jgi:hypothetical protein
MDGKATAALSVTLKLLDSIFVTAIRSLTANSQARNSIKEGSNHCESAKERGARLRHR